MSLERSGIYAWLDDFYANDEPIAVAVSGGADSMALLHLAIQFAKVRPVHAFIIDHALRSSSADDTMIAAKRAGAMGAVTHIKVWVHDGIKTAIQERAREARYGLLAQACRDIGTPKLLVGHTQDDQAETVGIREQNGSGWRGLAGIRDRVTCPIWPQARDLTLGRPLLHVSRGDIRAYCADNGIGYYDDPSNIDPKYQRVRVREIIAAKPDKRAQWLSLSTSMSKRRDAEDTQARAWISAHACRIENAGTEFPRAAIEDMPIAALADLLRVASGKTRRANMAGVERLLDCMAADDFKSRTLGGALVYARVDTIGIARDPGVLLGQRGRAPAVTQLTADEIAFWDGRFEVSTDQTGIHIGAFWPARAQIDEASKRALRAFPAPMRQTLPGFFKGETLLAVPALGFTAGAGQFAARDISFMRF